ncbi:unnamed protein product [Sympodiomycopsis kandeliae]
MTHNSHAMAADGDQGSSSNPAPALSAKQKGKRKAVEEPEQEEEDVQSDGQHDSGEEYIDEGTGELSDEDVEEDMEKDADQDVEQDTEQNVQQNPPKKGETSKSPPKSTKNAKKSKEDPLTTEQKMRVEAINRVLPALSHQAMMATNWGQLEATLNTQLLATWTAEATVRSVPTGDDDWQTEALNEIRHLRETARDMVVTFGKTTPLKALQKAWKRMEETGILANPEDDVDHRATLPQIASTSTTAGPSNTRGADTPVSNLVLEPISAEPGPSRTRSESPAKRGRSASASKRGPGQTRSLSPAKDKGRAQRG